MAYVCGLSVCPSVCVSPRALPPSHKVGLAHPPELSFNSQFTPSQSLELAARASGTPRSKTHGLTRPLTPKLPNLSHFVASAIFIKCVNHGNRRFSPGGVTRNRRRNSLGLATLGKIMSVTPQSASYHHEAKTACAKSARESDDDNGWTHAHAPLPGPRTPTAGAYSRLRVTGAPGEWE